MIGIYNTILINNQEVFRPNEFTLQREDVYAAELETCTGKRIADLIGWRYADLELSWDTIPDAQLQRLLDMFDRPTSSIQFVDESGTTVTETVILKNTSATITRHIGEDGETLWSGISVSVQFINSHRYEV